MYRVDMVAAAIFPRARGMTRALFFSANPQPGQYLVAFENKMVLELTVNETLRSLLYIHEHDSGNGWVIQYNPHGSPTQPMEWLRVFGEHEASASSPKITWHEDTDQMQRQLNRIRRREEILKLSINRPNGSAALFIPDMSSISRKADVPESTVRGFFDGRATNPKARDKILWAFGITSDEMEGKLWEP